MKLFLSFSSFLLFSMQLFSQETKPDTSQIFAIVETTPVFKGGEAAMVQYLTANVKFPDLANKQISEGKVFVSFVVEKDGSVSSAKVLRGTPDAPEFAKEALRVINQMPKWTPGIQNGKNVRTQYSLPFNFSKPK